MEKLVDGSCIDVTKNDDPRPPLLPAIAIMLVAGAVGGRETGGGQTMVQLEFFSKSSPKHPLSDELLSCSFIPTRKNKQNKVLLI